MQVQTILFPSQSLQHKVLHLRMWNALTSLTLSRRIFHDLLHQILRKGMRYFLSLLLIQVFPTFSNNRRRQLCYKQNFIFIAQIFHLIPTRNSLRFCYMTGQ